MEANKLDALEEEIRASAAGSEPVYTQLETSQRIIARITDGIYREPWAAFRELIANAYDADASHVVVETGAPEFNQIVVRDDGIGMSPRTLAYVLQNIGGSSKRTPRGAELNTAQAAAVDKSPSGRPLIGKIGIGMFAVAQLTQHFQIITKAKGDTLRTSATVNLQTHNEQELQTNENDYIAGKVTIKSERVSIEETNTQGTCVVLYSLRNEVQRTLKSTRRWNSVLLGGNNGEAIQEAPEYHIGFLEYGDNTWNPVLPWEQSDTAEDKFKKLFNAASDISGRGTKSANLDHFDEYLKLVWKLSLSLPIDYIEGHPFDLKGSSSIIHFDVPRDTKQANRIELAEDETLRERLCLRSGRNEIPGSFSVTLDGIALRRPVRLPLQLVKNSRVDAPVMMVAKQENPFTDNVLERAGGPLSFEGYLYWNSKIVPKDTTGALIRIRESSGTLFDPTFLNYQVSEQTRLRQITAEIFVHEGLDSAVNIDRESFNYSHPHFLYVQRWLHKALRLLVNRLKAISAEDLEREKAERSQMQQTALQSRSNRVWQRRYGEESDPPITESPQGIVPKEVGGVKINWSTGEMPPNEPEKVRALSVILEAYGVLSNLPLRDRSKLIKDIIDIFKVGR